MKQPTRDQRIAVYDQIAKLYKQGLSDSKIAKAVGCTRLTVFAWRQRNNKPTNHPKPQKAASQPDKKRQPVTRKSTTTAPGSCTTAALTIRRSERFWGCHPVPLPHGGAGTT